MIRRSLRALRFAAPACAAIVLAACSTGPSTPTPGAAPAPAPALPPSIKAEDIIGRWGYASYHKEADRPRIEKAAQGQCKQPYVIGRGAGGGVVMLTHDSPKPQELAIKGSASGRTFIGPAGEPGGSDDREVISFDGRILVLKWVDPEVDGRYGVAVYVRCGPHA